MKCDVTFMKPWDSVEIGASEDHPEIIVYMREDDIISLLVKSPRGTKALSLDLKGNLIADSVVDPASDYTVIRKTGGSNNRATEGC